MSGHCSECGNTLCVCVDQTMPSIADEYERLLRLLIDLIDETEDLKYQLNIAKMFHCPSFLTNESGGISCQHVFTSELKNKQD